MNSRIARKLRAVNSVEDLHSLLVEIANDPTGRWTRTQVLFYLPTRFHRAAEDYFDGERVVVPVRTPLQLSQPDVTNLDIALRRLAEFAGTTRTASKTDSPTQDDPPPLAELDADPPHSDDDVIGQVLQALLAEAKCVDKEFPKRFRLTEGKCIGAQADRFVYTFRWSSEPDLFLPGELSFGPSVVSARVGRQAEGDRRFELITESFVGSNISSAVFRVDPTFLHRVQFQQLKALRDNFDEQCNAAQLLERPDDIPEPKLGPPDNNGLNPRQRVASATVVNSQRSYVWGPPGTGKTRTLGCIIRNLVEGGKRVLVLSPYNVAVDEALLAATRTRQFAPETVVRFGRISQQVHDVGIDVESLLERRAASSGLLDSARSLHASFMHEYSRERRETPSTVQGCVEELGEIIVKLNESGASIDAVKKAVGELRQQFRAAEPEILNAAQVLGTTVALFMLSSRIAPTSYDYILVDEASVLRMPEALLLGLRTAGKIGFFGDPRQLPPIVRLKTPAVAKWVKPNPFQMASIASPRDAKGACILLKEQHRMAPQIREVISETFYEGALEDGVCPSDGRLILVDTSSTAARATTRWVKLSQSKENLVHRGIVSRCIEAIRAANPQAPLLVLSPYLAQKKAYVAEANTNRVRGARYGTVHASQGTESDIVIIDLVLAPGRGKSRFMNEKLTPEFVNLMNVAMSRARRQLILVGHCDYIADKYPEGLLHSIIKRFRKHGTSICVPTSLRTDEVFRPIWRT